MTDVEMKLKYFWSALCRLALQNVSYFLFLRSDPFTEWVTLAWNPLDGFLEILSVSPWAFISLQKAASSPCAAISSPPPPPACVELSLHPPQPLSLTSVSVPLPPAPPPLVSKKPLASWRELWAVYGYSWRCLCCHLSEAPSRCLVIAETSPLSSAWEKREAIFKDF